MSELEYDKIGLKVGLEIHQQLDTNKKLFCNCKPLESDEYTKKITRKLRISKSELGQYDPAALFENTKSKTILYFSNPESSCLVEEDEEPPHDLDSDAKNTALLIAASLNSKIFSEMYVMRKLVIDGSNTSGFQRTMLVSQGGFYEIEGTKIGIQSICLEEDAAKILGDEGIVRKYDLGRLGVPLVEIATEPFEVDPRQIKKIALALGRILRSTKKVKRGLGSIRQDVNVSIKDGGVVIEVKGVQQLDQLEKVVEYEAKRQYGLLQISKDLKDKGFVDDQNERINIINDAKEWDSKIIKNAIENKHEIDLIVFKNLSGIFGKSPFPGIRLGKDIAELVRFFGLGGVFHSDELPNYGISKSNVDSLKEKHDISDKDAFLILATPSMKADIVIDQILSRMREIRDKGIPKDTRLATQSGETKFLRPRPGASRMYPETDIPPVIVSSNELELAKNNIPKSWDESLLELQTKYQLNTQLAEQIFDSDYLELFEKICQNKKNSPNFVASLLCSTITNLQRRGLDSQLLKNEHITKSFEFLTQEKIAKESIEIIFENIMSGQAKNVEEAIKKSAISSMDDKDLNKILDDIIENNLEIIHNQGDRSIDMLMGRAMKNVRGKVSGEKVNQLLKEKIQLKLNNKNKK